VYQISQRLLMGTDRCMYLKIRYLASIADTQG
jgi:hypothetical protein